MRMAMAVLAAWMAVSTWAMAEDASDASARTFDASPPWEGGLPRVFPYGGRTGKACWAVKLGEGSLVVPSHCVSRGVGVGSAERDYRVVEVEGLAGPAVAKGSWPARAASAGTVAWVQAGSKWSKAKVVSAAGSSYWLMSMGGRGFCPGDSGSAVWAVLDGKAVWLGMVVSGSEPAGCSAEASAVKAQAIDFRIGGSERF